MNKEKKSSRVVMLIIDALIAAVLLVLDQFTKHLAVVHLKNQPAYVIIDGVLELQYLENRGSAFGMLQNQKVFILFVGIVFLAVLLFSFQTSGTEEIPNRACTAGSDRCRRHRQHDRQIPTGLCSGFYLLRTDQLSDL